MSKTPSESIRQKGIILLSEPYKYLTKSNTQHHWRQDNYQVYQKYRKLEMKLIKKTGSLLSLALEIGSLVVVKLNNPWISGFLKKFKLTKS